MKSLQTVIFFHILESYCSNITQVMGCRNFVSNKAVNLRAKAFNMRSISAFILGPLFFLLAALFTPPVAWGYSVQVKSGAKSCFVVTTTIGVPITGSYEIIVPDPNYVYVSVVGPNGFLHFEKKSSDKSDKEDASEGFFSFDAEIDGDYTMCIANGDDNDNDGIPRLIAFNFRAVAQGERDYQFAGLQSELQDLSEGLNFLKDHQSYMNLREDLHKGSLESINVKVLCWTILEAIILISMALWQIMYIRSFFETKRRL